MNQDVTDIERCNGRVRVKKKIYHTLGDHVMTWNIDRCHSRVPAKHRTSRYESYDATLLLYRILEENLSTNFIRIPFYSVQ
jgi:hypothetical protein